MIGVDLSPNGRLLVSASFGRSVCIWDLRDGSRRKQWYGSRKFWSVSFHPAGRYVAAGDEDAVLWVWDVRTGQLVTKYKITCSVLDDSFKFLSVIFTSDGKRLTTARNETVQCWDFALLRDTSHHDGQTAVVAATGHIFKVNGREVRSS